MRRRIGILAFILLASAGIAAGATGDNVVLVSVNSVTVPDKLPGLCEVNGTVDRALEGKAYHAGQTIALKVPCRGNGASLIPAVATIGGMDSPRFIAADILKRSKQGLARIDDSGAFIWDYTKRSYGNWGAAGGYRVVDGAVMPSQ